jgi:hypothetical protein
MIRFINFKHNTYSYHPVIMLQNRFLLNKLKELSALTTLLVIIANPYKRTGKR